MPTSMPPVPVLNPNEAESRRLLTLMLERTVYLLQWIASHPQEFVDGQHHHNVANAVDDLTGQLYTKGGWRALIAEVPGDNLKSAGLTGAQLELKFEAFQEQFQAFQKRSAALESGYEYLNQRLMRLEGEKFHSDVRKRPQSAAGRALELGETVLGSLAAAGKGALAASGGDAVIEIAGELSSSVGILIKSKLHD